MADWKDIAALIAPYAPTAGKLLGGLTGLPFGAAIGEKIGETVAMAFGLPPTASPDQVKAAIEATPAADLTARLEAVEREASARWEAMAKIAESGDKAEVEKAQAIGETQRAEIAAGVSPWHWRHLIGYLVLVYGLTQVGGIIACFILIVWGRSDPNVVVAAFSGLFNATTTFTVGLFGLLGWVSSDTSKLKAVAITGEQQPTTVEKIKSVVMPAPAVKKK